MPIDPINRHRRSRLIIGASRPRRGGTEDLVSTTALAAFPSLSTLSESGRPPDCPWLKQADQSPSSVLRPLPPPSPPYPFDKIETRGESDCRRATPIELSREGASAARRACTRSINTVAQEKISPSPVTNRHALRSRTIPPHPQPATAPKHGTSGYTGRGALWHPGAPW